MTLKLKIIHLIANWIRPGLTDAIIKGAQQAIEQKQAEADALVERTRDEYFKAQARSDGRTMILDTLLQPLDAILDNEAAGIPWDEQDDRITRRYFRTATGQRLLQHLSLQARRTLDSALYKDGDGQRMVDAAMGIRLAIAQSCAKPARGPAAQSGTAKAGER